MQLTLGEPTAQLVRAEVLSQLSVVLATRIQKAVTFDSFALLQL